MQQSNDFHVAEFLVSAGSISVCDLAEAVDVAYDQKLPLSLALLRSGFVSAEALTLASDAASAIQKGEVAQSLAVRHFQSAVQRGITFAQTTAPNLPGVLPKDNRTTSILQRAGLARR